MHDILLEGERVRDKGYTAIELLLTLGILAFLAFGALPAVSESFRVRVLRSEAARLQELLERGVLWSSGAGRAIELHVTAGGYQLRYSGDDQVLARRELGSSLKLSAGGIGDRVKFHPGGTATPATITVSNKGRSCHIVISLRGRIRNTCAGIN